jgi:hypothetical protein
MTAIPVTVTTPSGYTIRVSSVRAVARMLSGTGRASGGLRRQIERKALNGLDLGTNNTVRNNRLAG